jgi:hypothetical protein
MQPEVVQQPLQATSLIGAVTAANNQTIAPPPKLGQTGAVNSPGGFTSLFQQANATQPSFTPTPPPLNPTPTPLAAFQQPQQATQQTLTQAAQTQSFVASVLGNPTVSTVNQGQTLNPQPTTTSLFANPSPVIINSMLAVSSNRDSNR